MTLECHISHQEKADSEQDMAWEALASEESTNPASFMGGALVGQASYSLAADGHTLGARSVVGSVHGHKCYERQAVEKLDK